MVEAKHILLLTITAVSTYYKYQSVREGGDAFQKKGTQSRIVKLF